MLGNPSRPAGARFRYGIVYDLSFQDGRLTDGSEVWLGSLYPPRILHNLIPQSEWLSTSPLPVHPPRDGKSAKSKTPNLRPTHTAQGRHP